MPRYGRAVHIVLLIGSQACARRFLDKAVRANDVSEKLAMNRCRASEADVERLNGGMAIPIAVGRIKSSITSSSTAIARSTA